MYMLAQRRVSLYTWPGALSTDNFKPQDMFHSETTRLLGLTRTIHKL